MKLIYLDTETTGVDCKRHAVVQIAGTIAVDGKEEDFNIEMQPHSGAAVERVALWKNSYTLEDLATKQTSEAGFAQFDQLINRYIDRWDKEDKFTLVGYNAVFDAGFLREWYKRNGNEFYGSYFFNPPLDVMQLASWYMVGKRTTLTDFRLVTVYEAIMGKPLEDAHDAMADIRATRELVNFIFKNWKPS